MKKLTANVCAVSHSGKVRNENEDNYNLNGRSTADGELRKGSAYIQNLNEPFFMAACDGMGGENYGELASGLAVTTVTRHASNIFESGEEFSAAISNCLNDCNARICEEMKARSKRLGTTLAALFAVEGRCICTNIGDTRIYHYSKGILEQMSIDHTHAQTIVDSGQVPMDRIKNIPEANRLTRHLGVFADEAVLSPNIFVMDDIDNGDIILMCSDGLTDMVSDEDITHILSISESSQDAASRLIRLALENGGKDNITVLVSFMSVENTALFSPIAAAMVGDGDADYEEEYMNSYKGNKPDPQQQNSPYANANSQIADGNAERKKLIMIIGGAVAAVVLIALLAVGIKALVNRNNDDETTTSFTTATTQPVYIWTTISETSTELTSESTTETTTEKETTKRKVTTTKKKVTTTKDTSSATTKPSTTGSTTTTNTTEPTGTTAPQTSTTAPTTAATSPATTSTTAYDILSDIFGLLTTTHNGS